MLATHSESVPLLGPTTTTSTTSTTTTIVRRNNALNKSNVTSLTFWKNILVCGLTLLFLIASLGCMYEYKRILKRHEWVQIESIQYIQEVKSWELKEKMNDDELITLTFALRQQNVQEFHEQMKELADPESSEYGKHMSLDEVHEMLKPHQSSFEAVEEWLKSFNVDYETLQQVTPNGDFVRVTVPVKVANQMLHTEYWKWEHADTEKECIRVKNTYQVPAYVSEHIDFVSPTLRFPMTKHGKYAKMTALKSKDQFSGYVYPEKLWKLYRMMDSNGNMYYSPETISTDKSNTHYQVVASFLEEWYDDEDLKTFWSEFNVKQSTVIRYPEDQPDSYGSEATLDVQYITAIGQSLDTLVWDTEDDTYFLALLDKMMQSEWTCTVVSISYGGDEQLVGEEYCARANTEFAKVTATGVTFFASSGDAGALSSDYRLDQEGKYVPSFPASSPYVTAVGGTTGGSIQSDSTTSTGEVVWYNSGGGFSTFFEMFDEQKEVVSKYFENSKRLRTRRFNTNGRAYPDISAQAEGYITINSGDIYTTGGTSASCPVVAAMFALIDDARIKQGKSRLGWINPSLYKLGKKDQNKYFNDVVSGYNQGSFSDRGVAFTATQGWDACTGWGTPKFNALFDAFVNIEETLGEN